MSNYRCKYAYVLPEYKEFIYSASGDEYVQKRILLTKKDLEKMYHLYADDDTTHGYHIPTLSNELGTTDWRNEELPNVIFTDERIYVV